MIEAGHARSALLQSSMTLYESLLNEHSMDVEWERRGTLMVHAHEKEFEEYQETNQFISETFDVSARKVEAAELTEFEPALLEGLAGGYHYAVDAHLRPDRLMSELHRVLTELDVEVIERAEVVGFELEGRRCCAIATDKERIEAEHFVLATGAMAPLLQRQLRLKLPIQPGKGYSITMERPEPCPRLPLLFEAHSVVVTPMQSGYRLGSTMEFSGYDSRMNDSRLAALKTGAEHYLHRPYSETETERWFGWRPMTYDGIPIIGPSPKQDNVWVTAGHNMLGLSMGPATGQLLSEMIMASDPHIDPEPYRVARF